VADRVKAVGLEESVLLPGFREDLPRLLPCLDVLVHPALMEGLGVILLQAGAAGIPAVATAVGGIPEVVKHEETGVLVPPADPMALAAAIRDLLSHPERARSMGDAARHRVRTEFSVDRMVEGNISVYREVLGSLDTGKAT
jgi:glycosyltransferase involved in cell wall biosynthesis